MRIALSLEKLDPARGGAEVATWRLIQELVKRGHEVHILTTGSALELPAGARLCLLRVPWRFVAWRQISFARQVKAYLNRNAFDLSLAAAGRSFSEDAVWAQSGAFRSGVEGKIRRYYYYNPFLRAVRGLQEYYNIRTFVYRELERRSFARRPQPFIIAPSRMIAAQFERHYHVNQERTRIVPYQVDLARFSPERMKELRATARQQFGVGRQEVVIACVAQNFRRKGVRPLIEAASQLHARGREFVVLIAGSTARYAAPYVELARRRGCTARVRFLGRVQRIEELYAAADVFCLPTFSDPCAIATIEAMACGLASVTSRFNGAAELMQPGVNGFVLQEPQNPQEIATTIDPLFNADYREKVGLAAARAAEVICVNNPANEIARIVEDLAHCKQREMGAQPVRQAS
jgi:UDP-glucose:(heptosyl)LPS alpha-1,3-glucosyltransferase